MQPSMEVRWFLRGDMSTEIEDWFRKGLMLGPAVSFTDEKRDDIYLGLRETADLSVKARAAKSNGADKKLRAGTKLEVKQRQIDADMKQLWNGVEGRLEQWVKWSFDTPVKDEKGEHIMYPDISLPEGCWIGVKKRRLVRKFAINADNMTLAVDFEARPDEGSLMEITWLEALDQRWWSLSFEAFGSLDTVQRNLELVLDLVKGDPAFPQMQAKDSFAYHRWLGLVIDDNGKN